MKKIFLGALCAIALTISMTSCNSDIQCRFSDVKEVYAFTNEQGHVTGYGMTYKDGEDLCYAEIQHKTYEALRSGDTDSNQWLIFRHRHGGYTMYIDRSGINTTKLHD